MFLSSNNLRIKENENLIWGLKVNGHSICFQMKMRFAFSEVEDDVVVLLDQLPSGLSYHQEEGYYAVDHDPKLGLFGRVDQEVCVVYENKVFPLFRLQKGKDHQFVGNELRKNRKDLIFKKSLLQANQANLEDIALVENYLRALKKFKSTKTETPDKTVPGEYGTLYFINLPFCHGGKEFPQPRSLEDEHCESSFG